jgi:hypothetical protein
MDNKIIKINVGGTHFETKQSTLLKTSYFNSLFSGRWVYNPNEEIFIDRNPKGFEFILSICRGIPSKVKHITKYQNDLDFYGIIVKTIEQVDFKKYDEILVNDNTYYGSPPMLNMNEYSFVNEMNIKGHISYIEILEKHYSDKPNIFGETCKINIVNKFDTITNIYLNIRLNPLKNNVWKRNLGYKIIKTIKLYINNDRLIFNITGNHLQANNDIYLSKEKCSKNTVFNIKDFQCRQMLSNKTINLTIPINFFDIKDYDNLSRNDFLKLILIKQMYVIIELNEKKILVENPTNSIEGGEINELSVSPIAYHFSDEDIDSLMENKYNSKDINIYKTHCIDVGDHITLKYNLFDFDSFRSDILIKVCDEEDNGIDDILEISIKLSDLNILTASPNFLKHIIPIRHLKRKLKQGYYYFQHTKDVNYSGHPDMFINFVLKESKIKNRKIYIFTTSKFSSYKENGSED